MGLLGPLQSLRVGKKPYPNRVNAGHKLLIHLCSSRISDIVSKLQCISGFRYSTGQSLLK